MIKDTKENWREEQAKAEIGHTDITRAQAVVLTTLFLAALCAVPVVQHLAALRAPTPEARRDAVAFYREWDGVLAQMAQARTEADSFLVRFLKPNAVLLKRIDAYADSLDDHTLISKVSRAPMQELLSRAGVGNEKAFVGRDGWLFFDPGLRYVTGPAFLDPAQLARRARGGNEYVTPPQPDPVAGIVDFRDQLARHGVALLVVPAPVKPSIHPEKFTRRLDGHAAPVQNPSFTLFLERLQAAGVQAFDPAPALAELKRAGREAYLRGDTHWTPEGMEVVAAAVADFIESSGLLAPLAAPTRFTRHTAAVTNLGDIAMMLKLPADQTLFGRETVTVRQVRDAVGEPWRPDHGADVLLLGDSFANIYSLAEMGWGASAGLAEQLSAELERPLDAIVRNDAGAFATRSALALDLARGRDRLAGKKLVIWEFAARELAVGDWRHVELKLGQAEHTSSPATPAADGGTLVTATVVEVSDRPAKGAVYKDFVMKLYVKDMRGEDGAPFADGDGVVHVMGMRDRDVLPIAAVQPGAVVALRVRDWSEVEARYGSLKAGALDDIDLEIDKALYWADGPTASAAGEQSSQD